jgi:hypothetical protein
MLAARRKLAPGSTPRHILPPDWAESLYVWMGGRFAVKPSAVAGIYVLIPMPTFVGGFVYAIWIIGLFLFSSLNTSPLYTSSSDLLEGSLHPIGLLFQS